MTEPIGAGVRRTPPSAGTPTPAQLQAYLSARRAEDRAIRQRLAEDAKMDFHRALRSSQQSFLLPPVPCTDPEAPQRAFEESGRARAASTPGAARVMAQRPSDAAGRDLPAVVTASITSTLRKVDTPEWFVDLALPHAEARLRTSLLEQARVKAAAQGRTLRMSVVRADRIKRNLGIYRMLALAAYAYLDATGHRRAMRHANGVTLFTVLDLLPALTGHASSTCEAALADLRHCGLIATHRVYQAATFHTGEGEHASKVTMQAVTGVWACINLKPQHPTYRPMILRSELPTEAPRDLAADRQAGRTAWQMRQEAREGKVGESLPSQEGKETYQDLLLWALPLFNLKSCVKSDSPTSDSWAWNDMDAIRQAIYAVQQEHPRRRGAAVESAAHLIGRVLGDQNDVSVRSYCRMLWRGLKGEMQQRPALTNLLDAIDRTLVYRRESQHELRPLRAPGAYLRSVLAESGWLEREYRAA